MDSLRRLFMKRPEVSWSIMHPIRVNPEYMRNVIAAAACYRVDSFEICGDCHSWTGGLEGAIQFRDYPAAVSQLNLRGIEQNIQRLRQAVDLAHESGRPVYYWHREVMVPRVIVEKVPGLLDERGEFNLLGEAYHALLRSKLREFFDRVPAVDGLVLTLTESDYSVIHNSDPKRYPPEEVIEAVIASFASELKMRGKRFIIRSFGSIPQDYEDILAGARRAAARYQFEVETKITPYDFSPLLPFNPYLHHDGRAQLSAEYDSIGEFLGAGYLPAPDPQRVIDSVAFARGQRVDRHVIRIDRIGHPVFSSTQAINLFAFDRAIADANVSAESLWSAWGEARWPGCAAEMTAVMRRGIEMVTKTHFIGGNVIFHAFPIQPELKWIKSCGILSVFTPGVDLAQHEGMWGILRDRCSPVSRSDIMREKEEAVAIADEGLHRIQALGDRLAPGEFKLASEAWRNATVATRLIRAWTMCVVAYFDDMEQRRPDAPALRDAIAANRDHFAAFVGPLSTPSNARPGEHEYGEGAPGEDTVEAAYARPIWNQVNLLLQEFQGEFEERRRWQNTPGLLDYVICGGLTDDHRVKRYMHASHSHCDPRPARVVGNRVFPNGFIECRLRAGGASDVRLRIEGDRSKSRGFTLTVDGATLPASYDDHGVFEHRLPPRVDPHSDVVVRIKKADTDYPWIHGLGLIRSE